VSRFHSHRRRATAAAACGAIAAAVLAACARSAESAEGKPLDWSALENPRANVLAAPKDPKDWPAFRKALADWREATRAQLKYDDALYRRPDFAWVPSCFSCYFLMMNDELFYDPKTGRYTIDRLLDYLDNQFGGCDAIVLWHAYPRIGLDDRNQFDFYRDMPGGLAALKDLSRQFNARGVRVFVDYNPWDTGTRREGKADLDALADLVCAVDADGIFLDTMSKGAPAFRATLDAARPGVALEGEGALPVENIHDHHLSWAQGFRDGAVPGILRNKWFERRHLQHQIRRWDHDHTAEIQMAWMNGSGMMVWENVFGSWVGWCERDRAMIRSMLPIQRRYARLFGGERWTPLVPAEAEGVYASLWESEGLRLWTLVNRSDKPVEGALVKAPHAAGAAYYDLMAGTPAAATVQGDSAALAGRLDPRGLGAFVAGTDAALGKDFAEFLGAQRARRARAKAGTAFPAIEARLAPVAATQRVARDKLPEGMVEIPPAQVRMKVEFRSRECGFYESQSTPSPAARLHRPAFFEREARLGRYAIDRTPVTNAQYAKFLQASGYRPPHPENFLKHWKDGKPAPGMEDHPVVYVSLEDARAYARWAGKRLPTEEEWQVAAQGNDGRTYPWGNEMKPGACNDGKTGTTTPVTAHPDGRSPFGCLDMCGNVWEWTESERSDGRTRFAILRGGSFYQAKGSHWYFDGGPRPCSFAAKMLLMGPGLDRCGTVGFRCAADVAE
jgi:formylglycine-generating enzyme required for sulfatase activity